MPNQKETVRAGDVAQQMKVLATKPDSMSSISGTHMVRRENSVPKVPFVPLYVPWHPYPQNKLM